MRRLIITLAVVALTIPLFDMEGVAAERVVVFSRPLLGVIDPATVQAIEEFHNSEMVYNKLVELDKMYKVIPSLAESWGLSSDGREWEFRLRRGVKFHDGNEVNAQAVKFTLDRVRKVNKTPSGNYNRLADDNTAQVVDDYTIRLRFKDPWPTFLPDFAQSHVGVVSPKCVQQHATADDPWATKWMVDHECGSGPFKLVEVVPDQRMVFERFKDYWGGRPGGKTTPKVDKVIYRFVPDSATAVLMLERGEVDIAEKLTFEQIQRLKSIKGIQVFSPIFPGMVYLTYDVTSKPFDDVRVRRAISHAVNYDDLIKNVIRGAGKRLTGFAVEGFLGHNPKRQMYEYSPEKARKLLSEAGYPKGFSTTLLYSVERRPESELVAPAIQAYLKKVGIEAQLERLTTANQLAKHVAGKYGLTLFNLNIAMADSDDAAFLYRPETLGGWAPAHWGSKEVDKLIAAGRATADPAARHKVYEQIDDIAVKDAAYVYLYQPAAFFGVRENIANFHWDVFSGGHFWSLDKKK